MNEEFKRLKQQAFIMTELEDLDYDVILERFGQLVVKQCANICDERARSAPMGSEEQCEADDCSYSIKKYFGVNE
jgi:hypothetical protein